MDNYYAPFNSQNWVDNESSLRSTSARDNTAPPRDENFRPNSGTDVGSGNIIVPTIEFHRKGYKPEQRIENYNVINFDPTFENKVSSVDFQHGKATRLSYYTTSSIP